MTNQDLKKAGLKVTGPRLKILSLLAETSQRHLSAEEIYRHLVIAGEDTGIATVYRALTQFEQAGLITRHHFEGGQSVFELKSEQHHDHLVCVKCGKIEEFYDPDIEKAQTKAAKKFGYKITDHTLNIYGLCPGCQPSE